jgi:hypothetical protein
MVPIAAGLFNSTFAGQTAQLSITVPAPPYPSIDPNGLLLDDIRFLTIPCNCNYSISPTNAIVKCYATNGIIIVSTSTQDCCWQAFTTETDWIPIAGSIGGSVSGVGDAVLAYKVAPNTTTVPRIGTLNSGGQLFTIIQSAGPAILNPQVTTNQFGFAIAGEDGMSVVVEASSDARGLDWSPVGTNTLLGGFSYFSVPQGTNYLTRFYRLRWL